METIKFEGKEYPSVIVNFPFGERKISSLQLNDSLINFEGGYVSDEASQIDDGIFYFIEEDDLHLPKNKLVKLILSEL